MVGGEGAKPVAWQYQMSLFLIPVALYGLMMLGQRFPKSEASQQGISSRSMLRELGMLAGAVICFFLGYFLKKDLGLDLYVAAAIAGGLWLIFSYFTGFHLGPILLAVMLLTHALVGYVELGTDSWISKITGSIMKSPANGLMLFVYTSALMFVMRFFAGPIVEKTSPLGLLFCSGVLGALGLTLLGNANSVFLCIVAATVYACGKTFLWPTMLAVVSEQFPRGGAMTIGAMGGVGMLSAGLLGGPGIGFKQDYKASENLQSADKAVYERYKAPKENEFLGFKTAGLDGSKVGLLEDNGKEAIRALEIMKSDKNTNPEALKSQQDLVDWWNTAQATSEADKTLVTAATLEGGKAALRLTALVPAAMALIYLALLGYFRARGGYKAKIVVSDHEEAEMRSGGIAGPAEF